MEVTTHFLQVGDNHILTEDDPRYDFDIPKLNVELKHHQKTTLHKMITKEKYMKSRTSSLRELDVNHNFPIDHINIKSNLCFLGNKVGSGKTFVILGLIAHSRKVLINNKDKEYNLELLYYSSTFPKDICQVLSEFHNDDSIYFNYKKNVWGENIIDNNIFNELNELNVNLIVTPHSLINQWKAEIQNNTSLTLLTINNIRDIRRIEQQDNIVDYLNTFDIVLCNANKYNDVMEIQDDNMLKWQRVFIDEADTIKIANQKPCETNFLWLITATYQRFCKRSNIGFLSNIIRGFECIFYDDNVKQLTNNYRPPDYRNTKIFLEALTIKCDEDYIQQNLIVQEPNYNNIVIQNTPDILKFILSLTELSNDLKKHFLSDIHRFNSYTKDYILDILFDFIYQIRNLSDDNIRNLMPLLKNNHYSIHFRQPTAIVDSIYLFRDNIQNILNYSEFIETHKSALYIEYNSSLKMLLTFYTTTILKYQIKLLMLVLNTDENKFRKNKYVIRYTNYIIKCLNEVNKVITFINNNRVCIICEKNTDIRDINITDDKYCNFPYHFHCHIQDSGIVSDYFQRYNRYRPANFFSNTEYQNGQYRLHPFIINFSKIISYIESINTNLYNKTVYRQFFHQKLENFLQKKLNIEQFNLNYLIKDSFYNNLLDYMKFTKKIKTYNFIESKINFVKENYIDVDNKKVLIFSDSENIFNKIKTCLNDKNIKWGTISGNNKTIAKRLREYTSEDLNVLLLNNNFFASGINLQNTTDIVILNYVDQPTMIQVIGRAQRIGRDIDNQLNVNYILFENEQFSN